MPPEPVLRTIVPTIPYSWMPQYFKTGQNGQKRAETGLAYPLLKKIPVLFFSPNYVLKLSPQGVKHCQVS